MEAMKLDSQTIVVLGGTSGIGRAAAQLAADEGATVVVWGAYAAAKHAAPRLLPARATCHVSARRRTEPPWA